MTEQPPFTMSTNAHHPALKSVYRFSDGTLSINLGGAGYAHVSLLVTDEEWRAIVRDTDHEIARVDAVECPEVGPGSPKWLRDHMTEAGWLGNTGDESGKCPECDHWAASSDLLTEHVFAHHPEAVAR